MHHAFEDSNIVIESTPYVYEEDMVVVKPFNTLEPVVEATSQYKVMLMNESTPLLSKDNVTEVLVRPPVVKKATVAVDTYPLDIIQQDCIRKEVGVRSLIELITINDVQQSFKIDASLYLHWNRKDSTNNIDRTTTLGTGVKGLKTMDKPQWVPLVTFSNADRNAYVTEEAYFSDGDIYYSHLNWTIVIHGRLDLRHFPFDRQILMVVFSSHNCSFTDYDYTSGFVHGDKPLQHDMISAVYRFPNWTLEKLEVATLSHRTDALNVMLFMRREPFFYISNIVSVSFVTVLCSFTVCILDISNYSDRVFITLILMLTLVVFRYSIVSCVPQVPYMTNLDKYNIMAISALMVVVLECFVVAAYGDDYRNKWIELDDMFYKSIAAIWIIIHLFICVGAGTQSFHQSIAQVRKSLKGPSRVGKGIQSIQFKKNL